MTLWRVGGASILRKTGRTISEARDGLGVVSSRYNIERHNFSRELSLNVVN